MKIGDGVAALRRWWRDRRGKGEQFAPTDADLRQLTEHLFYEIEMTFDVADVLVSAFATPPASPLDLVVRNVLVESFTIHVRQLIDFFWSARSPRRKVTLYDAYAADYFEPGEWTRLRPSRPTALDRVMSSKVGWGVAHLTYGRARSTPQDKQWQPVKMSAALAPVVRCFIENVDPAKLDSQWFDGIEPCLDRFEAKYGSG